MGWGPSQRVTPSPRWAGAGAQAGHGRGGDCLPSSGTGWGCSPPRDHSGWRPPVTAAPSTPQAGLSGQQAPRGPPQLPPEDRAALPAWVCQPPTLRGCGRGSGLRAQPGRFAFTCSNSLQGAPLRVVLHPHPHPHLVQNTGHSRPAPGLGGLPGILHRPQLGAPAPAHALRLRVARAKLCGQRPLPPQSARSAPAVVLAGAGLVGLLGCWILG